MRPLSAVRVGNRKISLPSTSLIATFPESSNVEHREGRWREKILWPATTSLTTRPRIQVNVVHAQSKPCVLKVKYSVPRIFLDTLQGPINDTLASIGITSIQSIKSSRCADLILFGDWRHPAVLSLHQCDVVKKQLKNLNLSHHPVGSVRPAFSRLLLAEQTRTRSAKIQSLPPTRAHFSVSEVETKQTSAFPSPCTTPSLYIQSTHNIPSKMAYNKKSGKSNHLSYLSLAFTWLAICSVAIAICNLWHIIL